MLLIGDKIPSGIYILKNTVNINFEAKTEKNTNRIVFFNDCLSTILKRKNKITEIVKEYPNIPKNKLKEKKEIIYAKNFHFLGPNIFKFP